MSLDELPPDLPDAVSFYDRYVALCERLGVEPVAPGRAWELIEQWEAMFSTVARSAPETRH